jgi:ADP-heptose:LPS heptosyltransferase
LKKILIIQTAFIGDVILATPVIENLKIKFPQAQIDFLLRKGNESLLENHPHLTEVIVWNKKENKYKNLITIIKKIRDNNYDLVINLQRFAASGVTTALSGAKIKIGFSKNPFSFAFDYKYKHEIGNNTHEVQRNNLLLSKICSTPIKRPILYPTLKNFASVSHFKTKAYICMAPASVWFTKQLPAKKWVELIKFKSSNVTIYLLGASTDFEMCDQIIVESESKNCINLCGKLSFLESAALIKDATMNYVNDSAPLHIASAMNANVTAFYCSTIPAYGFGPLSDNSKIIETNMKLSCRPCGLHGFKNCPENHFNCANSIVLF